MKSITKSLILVAAVSSYAPSHACAEHENARAKHIKKDRFYIGANIGQSYPTDKWSKGVEYDNKANPSFTYGAVGGYQLTKYSSVELSLQNRHKFEYISDKKPETQSLSTKSVIVSGVYSIPTGSIEPYISLGAGVAFHKVGDFTDSKKRVFGGRCISSFAWQVGAGSKIALTNNVSLDIGYRYTDLGMFMTKPRDLGPSNSTLSRSGTPYEGNAIQHEINFGVVYKF